MKPFGVSDNHKSSEICDCNRTPIRKGICTCKCKKRKSKLSNADKRAYKSFKTSVRQSAKRLITKEI